MSSKTSVGILELDRVSSLPNLRSTRGGVGFEGTTFKIWNGTSWAAPSGSGGVTTWDELYDLDQALTLDSGTLTFTLTGTTGDGLTLAGGAAATGDLLQFSNAGSGSDIKGTSNTWAVSAAGALTVTSIADSATNATLQVDGNGSGGVDICSTSTGGITLGDDTTLASGKALVTTGAGGSDIITVTAGDVVLSDGSLTITDADNAATVVLVNNTITSADLITLTSTSQTTGNTILLTTVGLTSGFMFKGVTTAAGLTTGGFLQYDDGAARFAVKADGATAITTGVNSTKALEITGIQTSESLVTLTSSGVTASTKAIININSSGASASGSAQIRIAPSGSPVEGSAGIQFVGGSKVMQALNIDTDAATNSGNLINGGGAIATDKAVLELTADGTPANTSSSVLRVAFTGTATNTPRLATFVGTGKNAGGIYLDTDNTTTHGIALTGTGALNAGRTLFVDNDGTPAAATDFVAELSFTGTATNTPGILKLMGNAKNVNALTILSDNVGVHSVSIAGAGALSSGRMLKVTNTGTPAAATDAIAEFTFGGTATNNPIVASINNGTADALPLLVNSNVAAATREVAKFVQDSTTGANEVLSLQQDDLDQPFIDFVTTIGTGNAVEAIAAKSLTTTHFVMVKIPGGLTRYFPVGTIA